MAASHALAERLPMASPLTARVHPPRRALTSSLYLYPWTHGRDPEPVDCLILATWRADQLAAHLAARLEVVATALDDAPETAEIHALSLCAIHIRHLLAEVTQLAGAYVR